MIRALILAMLLLAGCASQEPVQTLKTDEPAPPPTTVTEKPEPAAPAETPVRAEPAQPLAVVKQSDDLALIGVSGAAPLPAGARVGGNSSGAGLYGIGGHGLTIVFCIDASGSMMDKLSYAIDEVTESLNKLHASQRFNVIFFQGGKAVEVPVPNRGMKKATAENIRQVTEWISIKNKNITAEGPADPRTALTLGLAFKPDVMFLLSDGIAGPGDTQVKPEEVLDIVDQARKQRHVFTRINVVQLVNSDPSGTLKKIAEKTGGVYRFVDETALNPGQTGQ